MEPLAMTSSALQTPPQSSHHHHHALHRLHQAWAGGFPPPHQSSPSPPSASAPGSSYEASVVATALRDHWAHAMLQQQQAASASTTPATPPQHPSWAKVHEESTPSAPNGSRSEDGPGPHHDDSGISPGRTSSSGPPSSGGSPPGAQQTAQATNLAASPNNIKIEQEAPEDNHRSSPTTQDDDASSESSEDTLDSLSRLQMALSQAGSPLGDIYNGAGNPEDIPAIQCPLCPHTSPSLPHLAAHLSTHAEPRSETTLLFCPACSFNTPRQEELLTHLATHFTEARRTQQTRRCSVCDFTTKSLSKLRGHLADVHGCELGEEEEEDVNTPKVNAQGKVKTFRCKQCNFMAVTKLDFWSHSRVHIKGEKVLSCPRCPFVTEYKHHLEYHLRNHSGSKPFKCPHCSYSCVNKSMLNSHLKSHSSVYQYRCADCNYATKYCHSLKLHLRKYTHNPAMVLNPDGTPNPLPIIDVYGTRRGPKSKPRPIEPVPESLKSSPTLVPPSSELEVHRCVQCEFSTSSQELFAQHLLTAHTPQLTSSRSPPLSVPILEKLQQQLPPHPLLTSQSNPVKEYLAWMYSQQQALQQYKPPEPLVNPANPLDLSKEVRPVPLSPAPPSASKNRRKGKAFKLERVALEEEDDAPPSKVSRVLDISDTNSNSTPVPVSRASPKVTTSPPPLVKTPEAQPVQEEEVTPKAVSSEVTKSLSPVEVSQVKDVTYNCGYCDILFRDVVMYTVHMGYHGYKDPFHCNMCGQQTADKLAFFLHIARSSHC